MLLRPPFDSKWTPRYPNGTLLPKKERTCVRCGKRSFLSGVAIVKRGYVVEGICLECVKMSPSDGTLTRKTGRTGGTWGI